MEHEVRVSVDQDTCIGCGLCAVIAPEVFRFTAAIGPVSVFDGDQVVSELVVAEESLQKRVLRAAKECPVDAIIAEETGE